MSDPKSESSDGSLKTSTKLVSRLGEKLAQVKYLDSFNVRRYSMGGVHSGWPRSSTAGNA